MQRFLPTNTKTKAFLGIIKFLRILKITKIFKANPFFDRFIFHLKLDTVVKSILKYVAFLLTTLHYIACLFYFISINSIQNFDNSWIETVTKNNEHDFFTLYITSLYFTIATAFTVGYGDIAIDNNSEMLFVVIFLIVGLAIYSYCLSNLISLFELISKKDNFYREKENSIKEFCRNHNLEIHLYHEIRNYLIDNDTKTNSFYSYRRGLNDIKELTDFLPLEINKELYLNIFKEKLYKVHLFKDLNNEKFMIFLISLIDIKYFNFNDIIFKPADIAKEVYIVWKGKLALINSLGIKDYSEYEKKKLFISSMSSLILLF